jgi:DNA-binding NarL/FixJ family response regulator
VRILIVEDDHWFGREIVQDVETAIPSLHGSIRVIKSEKEFRGVFRSTEALSFELIILDVMVQWDMAGSESIPEEDARAEGYFKAGIRCLELIRKHRSTGGTPVIVYSARDREVILQGIRQRQIAMEGIQIISKSGDPETLLEAVKQHIRS